MKIRLLGLAALAVVSSALGWDKAGHSLTAAIAYHDLEVRHPEIIPKMAAILKQASDYGAQLNWSDAIQRSTLPANAKRESLMLFILAARWPDDIKGDGTHRDKSPHDTHPWHYINMPYSIDGSPTFPAKEPNILTATAKLTADWRTATDAEEKANILCFLTHFVGDSHQPLHSTEAFSRQFPKGDAGGGVWAIHSAAGASKLHGFWDDVVIKGDDAAAGAARIDEAAQRIAREHPRASLPQLTQNLEMKFWIERETFPLAKRYAYLDGKLPLPKKGQPTTLTEGYKDDARRVAETQMALAGYRMADLLYKLLK